MHARELVELAALVAAHAPVLIENTRRIPAEGIEQYWTASKVRLDRWVRSLKGFSQRIESNGPSGRGQAGAIWGVVEEILAGEPLTRVWTAVLCAYDRRRGSDDAEPVARSVLIGHVEARHRVLTLLTRKTGLEAEAAERFDALRRRAERWADLLIGRLAVHHDVCEFAIEPDRAREFADDLRSRRGGRSDGLQWPLLMASLRAAFRDGFAPESPNAVLNARIASAVLSCYPPNLFDSTGLLRSLWMMRLTAIADDAQGMIESLLLGNLPTAPQNGGPFLGGISERRHRFDV